jgi:chorismate-pyruvate lyase
LNRWIQSLGEQPLGERLSMMPKVSRSAFEYAYLELSEVSIWIRRSSFAIDNALLWVAELFLPALDKIKD